VPERSVAVRAHALTASLCTELEAAAAGSDESAPHAAASGTASLHAAAASAAAAAVAYSKAEPGAIVEEEMPADVLGLTAGAWVVAAPKKRRRSVLPTTAMSAEAIELDVPTHKPSDSHWTVHVVVAKG
jgi:hypothetical protein